MITVILLTRVDKPLYVVHWYDCSVSPSNHILKTIIIKGPLVSADQVGIAAEFDRSVQAISRAFGSALVLALAIATVVWSMLSVKFGKRPVRIY